MHDMPGKQKLNDSVIIVVATCGTQDPISPKTGKSTAPLTLTMEKRPSLVYLMPTAKTPDSHSSSYPNAVETREEILRWAQQTGTYVRVEILALGVSNPADPAEVFPAIEQTLLKIDGETAHLPGRQFVVTPTSGTPVMRETLMRLLDSGLLPGATAYEVLNPDMLEEGQARIRPLELPPSHRRRPRLALLVDYENIPVQNSEFVRALIAKAAFIGEIATAYVGAAHWQSREATEIYSAANFNVYTYPVGKEAADLQLLSLANMLAIARPDINTFVVVTNDMHFFHGMVSVLNLGKKIIYWRSNSTIPESCRTLQKQYPSSIQIDCIKDIVGDNAHNKPSHIPAAAKASPPTPKGTLSLVPEKIDVQPGLTKLTVDEESLLMILKEMIPSIATGRVRVRAIAREKGKMCKVAVDTVTPGLDAVRACLAGAGQPTLLKLGARLEQESVSFVQWNEKPEQFIAAAIGPVFINKIRLNRATNLAKLYVPSDQVNRAVGQGALNLRLACRLTGYNIRILEAARGAPNSAR